MDDARARLDDGDDGLGDHGLDELRAAPRHEHIDDAACLHELLGALATEAIQRLDRLRVDSRRRQRVAHRGDEGGVRLLGRRA
ncbi:MAG: hypothetical protein K0Q58_987, partial [Microbacterium sp.]|nr:hypothetical protein [Microbacterium sp.]